MNPLLEAEQIEAVLSEQLGNKNPFRIEDYNFTGNESTSHKPPFTEANAILPQKLIRQSVQIKAHNSRVNSVQFIHQTADPTLLTVGTDHLAKLWD
jgi:hypothetical protein